MQMSPVTPKSSRSSDSRKRRSGKFHSSSPKKAARQPLQIRMNLTEMQMNEITTSFAEKLNAITHKTQHLQQPSHADPSARLDDISEKRRQHRHSRSLSRRDEMDRVSQSSQMTGDGLHNRHTATVERRRSHPSPLQLREAITHAPKEHGTNTCPSIPSPVQSISLLSPSSVDKLRHSSQAPRRSDSLYNTHGHWAQLAVSGLPSNDFGDEKSLSTKLNKVKEPLLPSASKYQARELIVSRAEPTPMFSPMALYFQSSELKAVKVGQKTLIGKNGWLERTADDLSCERKPTTSPNRMGILKSLKRVAKEIGDINQYRRTPDVELGAHVRSKISLNPREQSLLYCELEYYLQTALNDFISHELERGHLVPDNLKKVSDRWCHEHKSRVVGFRFDVETQIDLVLLHADTFTFVKGSKNHSSDVKQVLRDMKRIAREMRVRTFCQSDCAIRNMLESAKALGEIIKVSDAVQEALEEVFYFFRTISEREMES